MGDHYRVSGRGAASVDFVSLLLGSLKMRRMLKEILRTRLGVDEPLGSAFADAEGIHFIIDGKDRLTIPWTGDDNV